MKMETAKRMGMGRGGARAHSLPRQKAKYTQLDLHTIETSQCLLNTSSKRDL
jgi:hypothetical protein